MIYRTILLLATLAMPVMAGAATTRTTTPDGPAQPHIFAPGSISGPSGVDGLNFTPDGNTVVFDQEPWADIMIMQAHRVNGHWSTPKIAPFSGRWHDHDPAMAPDGSYLIFASDRPDKPGGKPVQGGHLWRVDRHGNHWGEPVRLPDVVNFSRHVYAPAVAANGDLYFQDRDNPSHQFHLYRAVFRNGHYQKPVQLNLAPPGAGAGTHELDPAIAPDESFIVFDANYDEKNKPDHLYIAFRTDDHWSKPVDLGTTVDGYQPWASHLGPDGHTLYFTSNTTIKPHYPRSRAQARKGLARIRAWDNGTNHIWSLNLTPWLQAHRRQNH